MDHRDARTLNQEAQEELRRQAIRLLKSGMSQKAVAEQIEVSRMAVHTWWKRYREGGWSVLKKRRRGRSAGEQSKLSAAQEEEVQRIITDKRPDQLKLKFALWNRQAVRSLIEEKFGVIFCRNYLLSAAAVALSTSTLSAATVFFDAGYTNAAEPNGPLWVQGSNMFEQIVYDYVDADEVSGGTASSQQGFNLFSPGGGGLDVTLLTWEFGSLSLMGVGVGDSLTKSPGIDSPGFEDYRYDDLDGLAVMNLHFYYDGELWSSGYLTRFIVEAGSLGALDAVAYGTAQLVSSTEAGEDFFEEVMVLSGSTGQLEFWVNDFYPVAWNVDNATFLSSGGFTVVPEPSAVATVAGLVVLALVSVSRKRRTE